MFHDFYQMLEEPFGVSPDPRFLYVAASHREALASLYYGVETNRGVMVLIAPPGSGKTTLIHQLIGKLKPGARTVFLFQTQCTSSEIMQYLLNDLGVDVRGMEMVAMHNQLLQHLTQERQAGRRFVLIVDEAQNLAPSVLETIRLLSNFETSRRKLLQILLVGQPQLANKLAGPALDQLQQRISICARLRPFNAEETAGYVAHRLKVAGYSGDELFTPEAMNIIEQRSKGIPRSINRLCFNALSLGFAMGRSQIDAEMMREVVADLEGERAIVEPLSSFAARPTNSKTPAGGSLATIERWMLRRRALGVAGVAATLLIALGWLQYARGPREHSLPGRTALASPAIASPATKSSSSPRLRVDSFSPTIAPDTPPALAKEGTEALPAAEIVPHEPSISAATTTASVDANTVKVVVRPGETLQRIALRTLGQDSNKLIREIQELNPRLKNPDHIEADQEIRLPQVPPETQSVSQ